jgi:2-polyprenyl-3-methyl-5-hydroxy-6-metoxy-1,4-benzoquinol methylase
LKEQLDFDKRLIGFRYQMLKTHLEGPEGLELGPAEGEMTQFLVNDFETLTVVEGSKSLIDQIQMHQNLIKVHSLFLDFTPDRKYNTIIMEHILEHVDNPVELLVKVKEWLMPGGKILLGVPNGNSIHRLVAVKMGLLGDPCELNSRDLSLGHRRVYTNETLSADLHSSGLDIVEMGGVFFKPLSNQQIQDNWNEAMIQGFYELGKDFPENAAEIYAVTMSA